MNKKFLMLMLSLAMIMTMMPTFAFATEEAKASTMAIETQEPLMEVQTETNVAKIGNVEYATLAQAVQAAQSGDTVKILVNEIALPSLTKAGITYEGLLTNEGGPGTKVTSIGQTQNSVLKNFEFNCEVYWPANVDMENCSFTGTGNALYYGEVTGGKTVNIKNCVFNQAGRYGIHFNGTNGNIVVSDSTIRGSVAINKNVGITFNDCNFAGRSSGTGHCNINLYGKAAFNNCSFSQDYTSGSSRGILMIDGQANVVFTSCKVEDGSGLLTDIFRRDCAEGIGEIKTSKNESGQYIGGIIITDKETSDINIAEGHNAIEIDNVEGDNRLYIIGKIAIGTGKKLTGGKYTFNPIAYVGDGYGVKSTGDHTYPYEVYEITEEEPAQKEIVIEQKTETKVGADVNAAEKTAAETVLKKVNVEGVADALTKSGKAAIVDEAQKTNAKLTDSVIENAKQVDISITVEAVAKAIATATVQQAGAKSITFEITPYAEVSVITSDGAVISSDKVEVKDSYLSQSKSNPILVVLGTSFEPAQVLHYRESGEIDAYTKTTKANPSFDDKTFTYVAPTESQAGTVSLYVTDFSTIKVLATSETEYTISFEANGGKGTMNSVKVVKGSSYYLPKCKFKGANGKTFAGWSVDGTIMKAGDKIESVDDDLVVVATWKAGKSTGKGVKTGDDSNIMLFSLVGILAFAGAAGLLVRKRRAR